MRIALPWSYMWCHLCKKKTFKLNDDRESEMQNIFKTSPRPKTQLHLSHANEFIETFNHLWRRRGFLMLQLSCLWRHTLLFCPLSRGKLKATCYLHRLKRFWGRGGMWMSLILAFIPSSPTQILGHKYLLFLLINIKIILNNPLPLTFFFFLFKSLSTKPN